VSLRPGDTVTCGSCHAQARVWTTGAQHIEGWPVLVTWKTPEGERTMIEATGAAARALTCRACGTDDPRAITVWRDVEGKGRVLVHDEPRPAAASPAPPTPAPTRGQLSLI
jgi:hypothetical protein